MSAEAPISLPRGNISTLSPDHPTRRMVDQTIELIGYWDRSSARPTNYEADRNGVQYLLLLQGVAGAFDLARSLGSSSTILDVGAGTTRGIHDLSRAHFAHDLDFQATVLHPARTVSRHLGMGKTHITPVEYLQGISDNSIAAVLGVGSIAYSVAPDYAMRRVNEVLVPGGIIKSTFNHTGNAVVLRKHDAFSDELRELGYDIAIAETNSGSWHVLLAIKPGGSRQVSAQELLAQDQETIDAQLEHIKLVM